MDLQITGDRYKAGIFSNIAQIYVAWSFQMQFRLSTKEQTDMTSTPVSGEVHRLRLIETAAKYTDHTAHQQSQRVTGIAWRMISQN